MKRVFSLLAVLTVSMFFGIATAGGAFAADADICNACNKVLRTLIVQSNAGDCPTLAVDVGVRCELGFIETAGAGLVVCGGIGVAVDIVCNKAGGVKKLRANIDADVSKICKEVKACK